MTLTMWMIVKWPGLSTQEPKWSTTERGTGSWIPLRPFKIGWGDSAEGEGILGVLSGSVLEIPRL
jgi:hypothetical protein